MRRTGSPAASALPFNGRKALQPTTRGGPGMELKLQPQRVRSSEEFRVLLIYESELVGNAVPLTTLSWVQVRRRNRKTYIALADTSPGPPETSRGARWMPSRMGGMPGGLGLCRKRTPTTKIKAN